MDKSHYWIVAYMENFDGTQQPYLTDGGTNEQEARAKAFDLLGGLDFTIQKLPTSNITSASRILKGLRLKETKSLREATKRVKHKLNNNRRYR